MNVPANPKIYHITHINNLSSIIKDGFLWSDKIVNQKAGIGTNIGMSEIKQRRLNELKFTSHPELFVGECVPFYFCPRSVMLYVISKRNHQGLEYNQGQEFIIHLEADLHSCVEWAERNNLRWVFTLSNAGSFYFEDRSNLEALHDIDWNSVQANDWRNCRENKQAEFLVEDRFPWQLIERVGVASQNIYSQVINLTSGKSHQPDVKILQNWYY